MSHKWQYSELILLPLDSPPYSCLCPTFQSLIESCDYYRFSFDHDDVIIFQNLSTVFAAILTVRQSGQKLQCLYGNPMTNNIFRT